MLRRACVRARERRTSPPAARSRRVITGAGIRPCPIASGPPSGSSTGSGARPGSSHRSNSAWGWSPSTGPSSRSWAARHPPGTPTRHRSGPSPRCPRPSTRCWANGRAVDRWPWWRPPSTEDTGTGPPRCGRLTVRPTGRAAPRSRLTMPRRRARRRRRAGRTSGRRRGTPPARSGPGRGPVWCWSRRTPPGQARRPPGARGKQERVTRIEAPGGGESASVTRTPGRNLRAASRSSGDSGAATARCARLLAVVPQVLQVEVHGAGPGGGAAGQRPSPGWVRAVAGSGIAGNGLSGSRITRRARAACPAASRWSSAAPMPAAPTM